MTNNFRILTEFETGKHHKMIAETIEKIEKMIISGSFEYVFIEARKILESLFMNIETYKEIPNLHEVVIDYTKMNIVPSKVKNALFFIKEKGNEDAHAVKMQDRPYMLKKDLITSIELLKMIFVAIKFFTIKNNENYSIDIENDYEFDSNLYLTKTNFNEIVDKNIQAETEALESRTRGIFELINSEFKFLIPTYQRTYSWTSEQVNVFLQDIKDRTKDKQTHYMGALALAVDNENKLFRLIDGQQRITTSLLIIKAIIEYFESNKLVLKMPEELLKMKNNLANKYVNNSGEYQELNHVKKLLSDFPGSDINFKNSNAYKNYSQIKDFLKHMSASEVDEFYTTFVYYFVVAELRFKNDLGSEIQIFENLNSKGLELSQWDLIKNYIYKHVDINLLIKSEKNIEHLLNELFVIPAGIAFKDSKYDELSQFFTYYSRIKHKILSNRALDDKGKIHKVFASIWPGNKVNFASTQELRSGLLEISKYFSIYSELVTDKYNSPDSPLFALRLPISNSSVKTAHLPLMMHIIFQNGVWEDFKMTKLKNKDIIFTISDDIDKYLTRLIVVSNKGQSLPMLFDSVIADSPEQSHVLLKEEIRIPGRQSTLPSYKDFLKELKEKNDWQKEYAIAVLRRLEETQKINNSAWHKILIKPTLEHIFPQKPKDDSSWVLNANLGGERFKIRHANHINMLGNYLILSNSLNSKAKNYDYEKKKEEYKNDDELKIINGGFQDSKLMNLLTMNNFDFEDIKERTIQLAELIAPLYKLSFEK